MKVLALVVVLVAAAQAGQISNSLKTKLSKGGVTDVIIELPSVNDVFDQQSILGLKSVEARTQAMTSVLKERTAASRQPFVNILKELGLHKQRSVSDPIWISNRFEVQNVDLALAQILARVPGNFIVREPKVAHIIDPVESHPVSIHEVKQQNQQWGVDMVQAPEAWAVSNGTGVVVGIIDTGVYGAHEALMESYAGAWLDPYYSRPNPDDTQSHGTHCIGSTLGRANGIGVAPGAQWIACRGLNDQGSGSEANLIRCAQWMLNDASPKPHIVTNSWGGGSGDDWYNEVMRAWIVADITPVFALGNSGSQCGTANSPGDQIYCIAVGATTITDEIAYFSSRGPTAHMLKPEVSAPGMDIISAGNSGPASYSSKSGTSMATPHTAGVIALLRSADPSLTFNQIKAILQETGDHPPVDQVDLNCGDGQQWPNNAFGHGRINAARALGVIPREGKIYF